MEGPPHRPSPEDTCSRMTDGWWNISSSCWESDPKLRPSTSSLVENIEGVSDAGQRLRNAIRSVIMLQQTTRPVSRSRVDSAWEVHQGASPQFAHHDMDLSSSERAVSLDESSDNSVETGQSSAGQRFRNAIRSVIMLQRSARSGSRSRAESAWETPQVISLPRLADSANTVTLRHMRIAANIEKMKLLVPAQELAAHQDLVRDMQFSPNGKYLATSSWDRTSVIFKVGVNGELSTHRVLVHVQGFICQVAWSPNGKLLLTQLTRFVKVWSEDGVCKKTIERESPIQSIVWLPTGEGTSIAPPDEPDPSRTTRVENIIIVYDMEKKTTETQTIIANDVRDISMARKAPLALISLQTVRITFSNNI
ncbi:hypothetical protein ID866_10532 [Astraeus odoratus]|nr:hypothetical protein ID866_10532 [Astraeus odoratus]